MNPNNPDMGNLGQKHGQKQSNAVTSTLYRNAPTHAFHPKLDQKLNYPLPSSTRNRGALYFQRKSKELKGHE